MDRPSLIVLIFSAAAFAASAFVGVQKYGGIYWLIFIPLSLLVLVFIRGKTTYVTLRNITFFTSVVGTCFLLRFYGSVTSYLGLNEVGIRWYFVAIFFFAGVSTHLAWGVLRNLYSPDTVFNSNTKRSIVLTYLVLIIGPIVFVKYLSVPDYAYHPAFWSDFVREYSEFSSLVAYSVFITLFLLTIRKHTPETIALSHDVDPYIGELNRSVLRKFLFPAVIVLALITEVFYPSANYPLLILVLLPCSLYLLFFEFLAAVAYRFRTARPALPETTKQPGVVAFILAVALIIAFGAGLSFISGFMDGYSGTLDAGAP